MLIKTGGTIIACAHIYDRLTPKYQLRSVVVLVQDPRVGHEHVPWDVRALEEISKLWNR